MRVEYNSNQINTLLDKGLLPIPSVDVSVDNGASPDENTTLAPFESTV